MAHFPKLTLVLGGASSGKSHFAESFAAQFDLPKTYIATAQAFDDEMREKIKAHRDDRAGLGWTTIEAPQDLSPLEGLDGVVLVDCLTMWLSNAVMEEAPTEALAETFLDHVKNSAAHVIAVSNEVGMSIVPQTPMGRQFRTLQGRLNAQIAAQADLVVQVTAGLPLVLKGSLP